MTFEQWSKLFEEMIKMPATAADAWDYQQRKINLLTNQIKDMDEVLAWIALDSDLKEEDPEHWFNTRPHMSCARAVAEDVRLAREVRRKYK